MQFLDHFFGGSWPSTIAFLFSPLPVRQRTLYIPRSRYEVYDTAANGDFRSQSDGLHYVP